MTFPLFMTSASLELMVSEVVFLEAFGATEKEEREYKKKRPLCQVRSSQDHKGKGRGHRTGKRDTRQGHHQTNVNRRRQHQARIDQCPDDFNSPLT